MVQISLLSRFFFLLQSFCLAKKEFVWCKAFFAKMNPFTYGRNLWAIRENIMNINYFSSWHSIRYFTKIMIPWLSHATYRPKSITASSSQRGFSQEFYYFTPSRTSTSNRGASSVHDSEVIKQCATYVCAPLWSLLYSKSRIFFSLRKEI